MANPEVTMVRFSLLTASCLLGAVAAATPAHARDIPITVQWSGDRPDTVMISDSHGDRFLPEDRAASRFYGIFAGADGPAQLGAVTLQYGHYFHTFQVRLNPRIPNVVIQISHRIQKSCTHPRVHNASILPSTRQEAQMRALNAGELLSIEGANACDKYLRFYAAQAKYMQTAQLVQVTDGAFLMDKSTEEQYRSAARARGVPVDAAIAANETREGELEVRRLVASSNRARANGDYRLALDINNFMRSRIESSPMIAQFYQRFGVTEEKLADDSQRLTDKLPSNSGNPYARAGERGHKY